jgi:hypothetical protein
VGFLLTIGTIQLIPVLTQLFGWTRSFAALAAGPAVGIALMNVLARERAGRSSGGVARASS